MSPSRSGAAVLLTIGVLVASANPVVATAPEGRAKTRIDGPVCQGSLEGRQTLHGATRNAKEQYFLAAEGGTVLVCGLRSRPTRTIPIGGVPGSGAIDASGRLVVPVSGPDDAVVRVSSDGTVTPVPMTGLDEPRSVSIDAAGRIYVANTGAGNVLVAVPGGGQLEIAGPASGIDAPVFVAARPDGVVHVGSPDGRIAELDPWRGSRSVPVRSLLTPTDFTEMTGLAVDDGGHVYAQDVDSRIAVYDRDRSGRADPLFVTRRDPQFDQNPDFTRATGLTVLPDREVLTTYDFGDLTFDPESGRGDVEQWNPLVPLAKPGAVRNVRVQGKPSASRVVVSFARPISPGDRPIKRYTVNVLRGRVVVGAASSASTRIPVKFNGTKAGRYQVTAWATNEAGAGPMARTTLIIK